MTMHKALHPRKDVNIFYAPRKERGRGFACIEVNPHAPIQRLKYCIEMCGGLLIRATRNNTDNTSINGAKITRKQKWEEKQLYEHFKR